MLDAETKRRIDTARDILVGKVPDPKSQVEQITIALIYKFMDDIDAESEEFGGKRKYFAGDFERFGWAKLMQPGLGGHETLGLYAEAIERMDENAGIPQLFRDIFRNAFLPYRDPETLRAFLKVIDGFTYDHSERLGDAFEYLLSVMDSQGDAGQFRTPRHIIDFIVSVVDPKKEDAVLDPACGTAGFLISSYKHVEAANKDADGNSTLTPEDRERLARNLMGYDISPDMVRLSLVNMYLHGLVDPHIYEYDTLTSEERWNEFADVIVANPPFMSPKGGIRPHNRFSVKARRSEVLFVDYIAEHLNAGGRAGIIVPEGIIFQSQNAHKQLRKKLVEESLVAVVSLPAGVFNPYSGVKTSILLLDKALARKMDKIAFFEVKKDGFDLGAQRRPIEENDLPQVREEIVAHLQRFRTEEETVNSRSSQTALATASEMDVATEDPRSKDGLIVDKKVIAEDSEYFLSREKYRNEKAPSASYPSASVGSLVKAIKPPTKIRRTEFLYRGQFPIIDQSQNEIAGWTDDEATTIRPDKPLVIFGDHTCSVKLIDRPFAQGADGIKILSTDEKLEPRFLYRLLKSHPLPSVGYRRHFSLLKKLSIPLPPLEVQKEIVAEIEGYQKVIDGARAVVENYRPHIHVDPEWPMVAIGELTKPEYGFTAKAKDQGDVRFVRITDISEDGRLRPDEPKFIPLTGKAHDSILKRGDVLVARTGATFGKTVIFEEEYTAVFASYLIRLRFPVESVDPHYYWAFAQSDNYWSQADSLATGGGQPQFNGNAIKKVRLPLPPLKIQRAIVKEIRAEQDLIESNCELIDRFEGKIQGAIARVWANDKAKAETKRIADD